MDNEDFQRQKADDLHDVGHLDEAIELYSHLLELHPDDEQLLTARSAAYIGTDDYRKAAEDAIAAYHVNPENAAAAFNAGLALDLTAETTEAAVWFHRACEIEPEFGKAHSGLANSLLDLGRFAEAAEEYERAERFGAEFDALHVYWGKALLRIGAYEEAAVHFEKQYQSDQSNAALAGIAQASYLQGNCLRAQELLERIVRKNPRDYMSLIYLMAIRRQEGWSTEKVETEIASVLGRQVSFE